MTSTKRYELDKQERLRKSEKCCARNREIHKVRESWLEAIKLAIDISRLYK